MWLSKHFSWMREIIFSLKKCAFLYQERLFDYDQKIMKYQIFWLFQFFPDLRIQRVPLSNVESRSEHLHGILSALWAGRQITGMKVFRNEKYISIFRSGNSKSNDRNWSMDCPSGKEWSEHFSRFLSSKLLFLEGREYFKWMYFQENFSDFQKPNQIFVNDRQRGHRKCPVQFVAENGRLRGSIRVGEHTWK